MQLRRLLRERMRLFIKKSYLFSLLFFSGVLLFPNNVSNIFLIALVFLFLLHQIVNAKTTSFRSRSNNVLLISTILLFLSSVVSMIYTSDSTTGWKSVQGQTALLAFPVLFLNYSWKISSLKKYFIVGVCLVMMITALIALHKSKLVYGIYSWEDTYKLFILEFVYQRFASHFGNHALYFGIFISISTAFCFEKLKTTSFRKTLIWIILVNSIFIILLKTATVSAAYFLTFGIGALYNINMNNRRNQLLLSLVLTVILNLVLFFVFVKLRIYHTKDFVLANHLIFYLTSSIVSFVLIYLLIRNYRSNFLKKMLLPLLLAGCIAMIAGMIYLNLNTNYLDYKNNYSNANARIGNWSNALRVIRSSPVFGVGIGDNQSLLLEQYEQDGYAIGLTAKYNEHNQFLRFWMSSGLPGLFIYGFILFVLLRLALKHQNYALLSIVLSLFLFSLTESWVERQKGIYLFSFIISIYLLQYKMELQSHLINKFFPKKSL